MNGLETPPDSSESPSSGKSSTLAAMIGHANENRAGKIVTIEDPIEFLHRDARCTVIQRELGADTESFSKALRAALRQDPDIVLVGEMRDKETIDIAMKAVDPQELVAERLYCKTLQLESSGSVGQVE